MSRRHFFQKMIAVLKTAMIAAIFPARTISAVIEDAGKSTHYSLLNGRSLREMARQKIHHSSNGFTNPLGSERHGRFWKVMRWKLFHENRFKDDFAGERLKPVSIDWKPIRQHNGLSITFLKHASVMIKDKDRYLCIDPIFSDIFWFIKDFSPFAFDLNEMPAADHILITHGHYDHLDKPTLETFDKHTHIITPLGYNAFFEDLGLKHRTQLDWFETHQDGNRRITLLPCNHWTMRSPFKGPNRSLWGSYLLETSSGHTIYLSGDTAYFDGFDQIGNEFEIDLAIFNLGAYEPRWFMASSHINPAETVSAFKALKAARLMIIHWGTFRLGDEPVHFPPIQIKQELAKEGLLERLVDLKHGQTLYVDPKS
jgi:L-ascorbate metabolism protein UlaG (beta-lactamase superfamily)